MDDIADDCTCGVCLDLFTDPRILPCGHTYCQKCVECLLEEAGQNSTQCPECRAEFRQPATGFSVNYGMLGMVGKIK
ncbi:E3 ubiquitin-protein ligase TRIM13, partial [Aphelenchoides avenae]